MLSYLTRILHFDFQNHLHRNSSLSRSQLLRLFVVGKPKSMSRFVCFVSFLVYGSTFPMHRNLANEDAIMALYAL